jgi:hypothetical protein
MASAAASVVKGQASLDILGDADIERVVGAAKDVDEMSSGIDAPDSSNAAS